MRAPSRDDEGGHPRPPGPEVRTATPAQRTEHEVNGAAFLALSGRPLTPRRRQMVRFQLTMVRFAGSRRRPAARIHQLRRTAAYVSESKQGAGCTHRPKTYRGLATFVCWPKHSLCRRHCSRWSNTNRHSTPRPYGTPRSQGGRNNSLRSSTCPRSKGVVVRSNCRRSRGSNRMRSMFRYSTLCPAGRRCRRGRSGSRRCSCRRTCRCSCGGRRRSLGTRRPRLCSSRFRLRARYPIAL